MQLCIAPPTLSAKNAERRITHSCTNLGRDPRDTDLQRIVWQSEEDNVARHYQLLTVTYGTSCAPYLAIRTLLQLAEDEGSRFPLAKQALRSDTYVDDIVTGAEDIPSACKLRDQLIQMLQAGGFPLNKVFISPFP